jgi:hypothetical protein
LLIKSPQDQLSTEHLHPLPVVFEVAEPVHLPADGLHLIMKSLGDAVGDFLMCHFHLSGRIQFIGRSWIVQRLG